MTKEKWYVEFWTWDKTKDCYAPCCNDYLSERDARQAFDDVRLSTDVFQKSLYKDDGEMLECVEQWVLTSDGEYQMNKGRKQR